MWIKIDKENSTFITNWTFNQPEETEEEPVEPWIEVTYCPYITAEKLESGNCRFIDNKIRYLAADVYFYLIGLNNYIYSISSTLALNSYCSNLTWYEFNQLFPNTILTDGTWRVDENGLIIQVEEREPTIAARIANCLRKQRETDCFPIINRGLLWYNSLSPEQMEELSTWYQAWLDVTETLEPPEKPSWLE